MIKYLFFIGLTLLLSSPAYARIVLKHQTTFYVNGEKGSDSHNCLSPRTACKHPQVVLDRIADKYDIGPHEVRISLAPGQVYTSSYPDFPTIALRQMVGRGSVVIDGGGSLVTSTSWDAIDTQTPMTTTYHIQNVKLSSSAPTNLGQGFCILVQNSANVRIGDNTVFLTSTGGHIGAQDTGALVQIGGDYLVSGSAPTHYNAAVGGQIIQGKKSKITIIGRPQFKSGFALAYAHGTIYLAQNFAQFVGQFEGLSYNAQLGSVIYTNGAGGNFFPGSAPGFVDATSVYK